MVFFSTTPVPIFDPNTLDFDLVSTQFVKMDEMLLSSDWEFQEWSYTADFAYSYIYVGYMGNVDDAIENIWSTSGSVGFYVWYDMVSVVPIDSVEMFAQEDITICQGLKCRYQC